MTSENQNLEANALLTQLTTLLRQAQPAPAVASPFQNQPFISAAPTAGPVGLLVGISIPMQDGTLCACYVQLGAEAARNPQAAIAALAQQGWPVRSYQQNNNFGQRRGWGRSRW
jgi:hypothetical protein